MSKPTEVVPPEVLAEVEAALEEALRLLDDPEALMRRARRLLAERNASRR